MSYALFQSLGLEREEPMISFEELMDSIKPSEDNFEKYKRFFVYETINDSIIQRYESTPGHKYASGPTYLNFKSGKVYGDYPYKHFHRIYDYEFEEAENLLIKEFRNQTKMIQELECFKVIVSYTKILEGFMDNEFPEFNSLLQNQEIQMEMWVTERIKTPYHPIVKNRDITEKFYPLEIVLKNSNSQGMIFHYLPVGLIIEKQL